MGYTLHMPKFDASLNTDWCNARNNAELLLTLRLGFRQVNPAGDRATGTYNDYGSPNGKPRKIVKWSQSAWTVWKATFCRSAERFWNGKFWILNRSGILAKRSGAFIFIPNIWCKFDIIGNDAAVGRHHHVIDVVRLDPTESWFGSHATLYDSGDINAVPKKTDSKGKPILQRAHVHEIGHLLGLGHVDIGKPHCTANGNTNASDCYGISDNDMNSVMGAGMRLDVAHAAPWVRALQSLVRTIPPAPIYLPAPNFRKPFRVSKRRLYPRTVAEFEADTIITRLLPRR
ncbi:MAG: hypothetical protein PGN21_00850 [Sphingomonas paucimobilis]